MNEREKQILYTIISHYIQTGESVGSRTIEKKYEIGVSSATIRNAMSDLEDKGLISKMHASSGRIPTEEGYKIYIHDLKHEADETPVYDVDSYIELKTKQVGIIIKYINDALARLSSCTAVALEPSIEKHKLRKIEIVQINERRAYIIGVTDLGIVKAANINFYNYTSEEVLKKVTEYLNSLIVKNEYSYTLNDLVNFLSKFGDLDDGFSDKNISKLYLANESSMLLHYTDELVDGIQFVENKENFKNIFKTLVDDKNYEPYDVNIKFGSDISKDLKDFVVMFSVYEYEGERGILGIIGPHRMNYKDNFKLFRYMNEVLKQSLASTRVMKLLG